MKKKLFTFLLIILWVTAIAVGYCRLIPKNNLLQLLHLKNADFLLSYRYTYGKIPDSIKKIIIVDIDPLTIKRLGQRWPINRGFLALLLKKMYTAQSKPLATGFDLIFSGRSEQPEADVSLVNAFKESGSSMIACHFDEKQRLILPEKIFTDVVGNTGFIDYPRDYDLTVRRAYAFMRLKNGKLKLPLMFTVFSAVKNLQPEQSTYDKKNNLFKIPALTTPYPGLTLPLIPRQRTFWLNFFARQQDFKLIPLWKALSDTEPAATFKDKIVLVGSTAEIGHDTYPTPLGVQPGLIINANFLLNLLTGRHLRAILPIWHMLIFIILGCLVSWLTFYKSTFKGFLASIVAIAGLFATAINFIFHDIIFDFFGATLVVLVSFLSISGSKYFSIIIENIRLKKLAITDGLTGLFVFRYFEAKLNSEVKTALEEKRKLSLVIFDIDHFKLFNDTYGHEAGNEVLKVFASVLRKNSRLTDTVARFGGEEFVSVLSFTDLDGAQKYAEAIRKKVEATECFWQDQPLKITVSAGVSSLLNLTQMTPQGLISAADAALYQAKAAGRNRVACQKIS